jgi:hypothetical protein
MGPVPRLCWTILLALPLTPETPRVTELPIRLRSALSTEAAKAGDSVEAVVIAGAYQGSTLHGRVESSTPAADNSQRAALRLVFAELETGGRKIAVDGRVAGIDNSRESVDLQGCIQGILESETISGKLDQQIDRVGEKYSGVADVLNAIKGAVLNRASTEITLPVGTEMTIRMAAPLPARRTTGPRPISDRRALAALRVLIDKEPFQTMAQRPSEPSDVTNLLLIGDEETLRRAFAEAGWALAASLTPRTRFETLVALAENRGYAEAPVSVLTLDGKPPGLVFEKTTDTFARRHHARLWRRAVNFRGTPVWAVAATHDTGISFSDVDRTFIHRIDSQIDWERQKVADDLVFAGHVQSETLLPRPAVPKQGHNATGDLIETDGAIKVLILH